MSSNASPSLLRLAVSDGTPRYALIIAAIVGTILTIINHGDLLLAGEWPNGLKVILTYMVPYCVSTYGAVSAKRAFSKKMKSYEK